MNTHSSFLVWRIPWTEEPVGLQSLGSQRVDMTELLTLSLFYTLGKLNFVDMLPWQGWGREGQ